jgi:hypothetical protein
MMHNATTRFESFAGLKEDSVRFVNPGESSEGVPMTQSLPSNAMSARIAENDSTTDYDNLKITRLMGK